MSLQAKKSHLRKHSAFPLTPSLTKSLIHKEFIPNTWQRYWQTVTKCLPALVPKRFKQNKPAPFHILNFTKSCASLRSFGKRMLDLENGPAFKEKLAKPENTKRIMSMPFLGKQEVTRLSVPKSISKFS